QLGEFLLRGKLVGDGPVRRTCTKTQLLLVFDIVDLEHYTIDVIRQAHAPLTDITVVGQAFLNALGQLQFTADRYAPGLELLQHRHLGARQLTTDLTDAVAAELQRTAGGDLRVELTQAAGSRVARVGEGLAANLGLACVELLEAGLGHEHLTAHFQYLRPALALQLERHVTDGAHVAGDVLARAAVAAGSAAHQLAVLVAQADGQAIELGFAAVFDFGTAAEQITTRHAEAILHAAVEGAQIVLLEG